MRARTAVAAELLPLPPPLLLVVACVMASSASLVSLFSMMLGMTTLFGVAEDVEAAAQGVRNVLYEAKARVGAATAVRDANQVMDAAMKRKMN